MTYICAKCKIEKNLSEFYKYKDSHQRYCKECTKEYNKGKKVLESKKLWREKNPDYDKIRCKEKAEQLSKQRREYYKNNKEEISKKSKIFREKNKKTLNDKRKLYYKNNKEKVNLYWKKRKIEDISVRIKHALRNRIRLALKNNQKTGSAVKDLGCSVEEFKIYLEAKFQPGMTWENWSRTGWHIDHIKPLDSFNLSDREEYLKAVHYTNMQPLWAIDNLTKTNKIL